MHLEDCSRSTITGNGEKKGVIGVQYGKHTMFSNLAGLPPRYGVRAWRKTLDACAFALKNDETYSCPVALVNAWAQNRKT